MTDQLRDFLLSMRPPINKSALNRELELPVRCIQDWLSGKISLPEKHRAKVLTWAVNHGYPAKKAIEDVTALIKSKLESMPPESRRKAEIALRVVQAAAETSEVIKQHFENPDGNEDDLFDKIEEIADRVGESTKTKFQYGGIQKI